MPKINALGDIWLEINKKWRGKVILKKIAPNIFAKKSVEINNSSKYAIENEYDISIDFSAVYCVYY